MESSSEEKKKIFYAVVLLLTLIVMIIGATTAYFQLVSSQQDEGTKVYTGRLEINYIDGTYIKNPELLPMTKPSYDTYDNVYRNRFSITSSGTLDQTISIDLKVNKNEFEEGAIKYIIYNDKGMEMSTGAFPLEGKVNLANNLFLANNETATYTLIVWLDNLGHDQLFEVGNTFTAQFFIESKQVKY